MVFRGDKPRLVGTKYSCGICQCGSCTVHINDEGSKVLCLTHFCVKDDKVTTNREVVRKRENINQVQQAEKEVSTQRFVSESDGIFLGRADITIYMVD